MIHSNSKVWILTGSNEEQVYEESFTNSIENGKYVLLFRGLDMNLLWCMKPKLLIEGNMAIGKGKICEKILKLGRFLRENGPIMYGF